MNTQSNPLCCRLSSGSPSAIWADQLLNRMIVTDYYDGPVTGFLQCEVCLSVYFFTTIALSRNGFKRVLALGKVPNESWSQLCSFFQEVPSGRQWIPTLLSRAADRDSDRIEAFVQSITSKADATSLLLAWDVISANGIAARRVEGLPTPAVLNVFDRGFSEPKPAIDWFTELEIATEI